MPISYLALSKITREIIKVNSERDCPLAPFDEPVQIANVEKEGRTVRVLYHWQLAALHKLAKLPRAETQIKRSLFNPKQPLFMVLENSSFIGHGLVTPSRKLRGLFGLETDGGY
jgi:hypothetical protein